VIGLVLELFLEARERAERLFQLAVLERHGRVARERLEQLEVVRVERAQVAEAIGDQDRSHEARLPDERRVHRVPETATGPIRTEALLATGDEERPAFSETLHELGIVERGPDRLHHVDRLAGSDARPQDVLTLGLWQERDLGDLGPEHLAGVVEQGHECPIHLRASLHDPGGLVKHLEAFVLLALRDVCPVRDEDRDDRDREQEGGSRLDEEDGDHEQRQAGVRERDHLAHHQHPRDPSVLGRTLGEGDRGRHGEDPDHVLGRGRQERCWPIARPDVGRDADEHLDDTDGHHRAQEELGEIERELDRPLAPVDHECQACPDQAGDDELPWCEEEDPVDDRDLAHRERVGASADVEMDDLCLCHVEDDCQQPPGQGHRSLGRRPGRELRRRKGKRDRREHHGQGPDAGGAGRRRREPAHGVANHRSVDSARGHDGWVRINRGGPPRMSTMLCRWPDPAGFMQSLALDYR
jgi:hypothetical protein